MGFFICSIALLIIAIVLGLIAFKFDSEGSVLAAVVISIILLFCALGFGSATLDTNPEILDKFIYEKLLIEGSDNQLLIRKGIEWNIWLQGAQRGRRSFGWFSTQPEAVLILTPIE